MLSFLKYQKLTILWALFVLVLCCMPMGSVETDSPLFFPGFDKLVHCGFFFVFTVLLSNGLIRQHSRLSIPVTVLIVVSAVVFGGVIELLQLFVFTWRDGDWSDLFADAVGVGMATFCTLVILSATRYEKA